MDAIDKAGGAALDGIGTGFVVRFAGTDIGADLFRGERQHEDSGTGQVNDRLSCRAKTDGRVDPMRTAGQKRQHALGVSQIGRLPEDLVIDTDDGVGRKNNVIAGGCERLCFLEGQTANELFRGVSGFPDFGYVGWLYPVFNTCGQQKFVAAGRSRG